MTTQTLSAPKNHVWLALLKTNRTKYLAALSTSLAFIVITLILPTPWQLFSAALGLVLLSYVTVRPLTAYFIYDWGKHKEYDILAKMGQVEAANCLVEITCGLPRSTLGMHPHFAGNQYYLFNIFNSDDTPSPSLQHALDVEPPLPKLNRVFPRQAAPGRLPLPDGFANVVYADFVLHELADPALRQTLFEEIRRTLNAGDGRLLIAEHSRTVLNLLLLGMRSRQFVDAATWQAHFEAAGLEVSAYRRWRGVVNLWVLERRQ